MDDTEWVVFTNLLAACAMFVDRAFRTDRPQLTHEQDLALMRIESVLAPVRLERELNGE